MIRSKARLSWPIGKGSAWALDVHGLAGELVECDGLVFAEPLPA